MGMVTTLCFFFPFERDFRDFGMKLRPSHRLSQTFLYVLYSHKKKDLFEFIVRADAFDCLQKFAKILDFKSRAQISEKKYFFQKKIFILKKKKFSGRAVFRGQLSTKIYYGDFQWCLQKFSREKSRDYYGRKIHSSDSISQSNELIVERLRMRRCSRDSLSSLSSLSPRLLSSTLSMRMTGWRGSQGGVSYMSRRVTRFKL